VTTVQRSIKPRKASKRTAKRSIQPGKASKPNGSSWILLEDALVRLADAYRDMRLAVRILCRAFVESRMRARPGHIEGGYIMEQGQSKEYEHNVRIGDLWRREYFAVDYTPYHGKMQIDWQSSSATLRTEDGNEVTFYRIEVALEDLLTLLPEGLPSESPPATALQPPVPKVAPARSKGLKRGPQGYSEQELKRSR